MSNRGSTPASLQSCSNLKSDRVASSLLKGRTLGFTACDTRGVLQLTEPMTVFAGVENFTDKNYWEHFDFRSQGGQSVRQLGLNLYLGSQIVY